MTEEEKDYLAVRIKHRGPCPLEKGHSEGYFGAGLFLGVLTSSLIWFLLIVGGVWHK